jgi:cobalt-zinc-cadmium efflux system outer membrane protein
VQAGLAPNPELDIEVEEVAGPGNRAGFGAAETTIMLSQLVELGDKRRRRLALAGTEAQLAGWDYEAVRLDVLTGLSHAFVDLLAAQEKLKLASQLHGISAEMSAAVAKRVDAGKDSPVAKSKAEIAHSQMKISLEQAAQNLHVARIRLASFWDDTEPKFDKAAGNIDALGSIPELTDLFVVMEQNPDLARWTTEIELRRRALQYEKARAVRDIRVGAGLQRFEESGDNALTFGISIPLGVGDRNQGNKEAAAHSLTKAAEQRRATYIQVRQQLARAYQNMANAHVKASTMKRDILAHARTVFEASQKGYDEGKLDYLNLLDAQRTLFEVRSQHIEALVAYQHAKVDVERLTGHELMSTK